MRRADAGPTGLRSAMGFAAGARPVPIVGSYTNEGAKGFAKEGGTARREAVVKAAESVGGKLDAMYYALGKTSLSS